MEPCVCVWAMMCPPRVCVQVSILFILYIALLGFLYQIKAAAFLADWKPEGRKGGEA